MDTLDLRPSVMDVGVEAPRRDELIHEHPRASVPEPRCMGLMSTHRAGEIYGDPTVKSWSTNHTEVDKVVGERRGEYMFTVFVTACLFSVAVAALAIEGYNMLSLDFCDEFMLLSTHILSLSQEPVNASESKVTQCHWNNVAFQGNAPFKPSASAIRIVVLFSLSLVLILTTVFSAALAPQLQRPFSEISGGSAGPPTRPVEAAFHIPPFLSGSVFLFIAGLFDFLLSINKMVAFCVLVSVAALNFVCLACTALPSLCPYEARHDSLPRFIWRVSQILGLVVLVVVGQIGDTFTIFCRRFRIKAFCAQQSILVLQPR